MKEKRNKPPYLSSRALRNQLSIQKDESTVLSKRKTLRIVVRIVLIITISTGMISIYTCGDGLCIGKRHYSIVTIKAKKGTTK